MNYKALTLSILAVAALSLSSCSSYGVSDVEPYKLEMEYKSGFKIMQLTDVHIAIQTDLENVKAIISQDVKEASPDLIVFTGDTFMESNKTIVRSALSYFDSLNVPFAFTYGNHDFQGDFDSYFIQERLKECKNAMYVDFENDNIYGQANYFIDLKSGGATKYRLYVIDSNNYHRVGMLYPYDIIHEDQIQHIENIAKTEGNVPSLAFFHIPLYEWDDAYKAIYVDETSSYYHSVANGYDANLEQAEKVSYGYMRNDAFSRFKACGIQGMFVGHDHINNTTMVWNDVILSYGVKSSYEIYNDKIGYTLITLTDSLKLAKEDVQKIFREEK